MKENDVIWVSIEESDRYELSNYGFVRNKYTKKEKSFTYIKNNKYKAYCIDGIQYLAHRLVAKYFLITILKNIILLTILMKIHIIMLIGI